MMKKLSAVLLLTMCATQPLWAGITVRTTSPGSLERELGGNALVIDNLTVAGPIDASDFATMWRCAWHGNLVGIDLSQASISDATVPPYAFFHPDEQLSEGRYTPLKLRSLTLPSDLQEIGQGAMAYTQLTTITLPADLYDMGSEAFSGCAQLTGTITIPANVTRIPADCFRGCVALEGVSLPKQLRTIGAGAFADCGIRYVDLPKGLRTIGQGAFRGARRLETICIPNSCTRIEAEAFGRCSALTYLQLPDFLTTIPEALAANCPSLLKVELPDYVEAIDPDAFRNCPALRTVYLPATLEGIGGRAFEHTGLYYIVLPGSLKIVGQGFISNCPDLKAIYSVSPAPPLAGEEPYNNDDQAKNLPLPMRWNPFYAVNEAVPVYVPKNCISSYKEAWGWSKFTNYRELSDGFDPAHVDIVGLFPDTTEAPVITSGTGSVTLTAGTADSTFEYSVCTIDGSTVAKGRSKNITISCPSGIYVVKAGNIIRKVVVK